MEKKTFTSKLEQDAMTEVPIYETHSRGRNWLAVIEIDPKSPSGLSRNFVQKARGKFYYFVTDLKVGDAVEFGADYYTSGGNKSPRRLYALVTEKNAERITFDLFDDSDSVFDAQKQFANANAPEKELLEERARLLARLQEIENILASMNVEPATNQ
jgi:hypothetical protein